MPEPGPNPPPVGLPSASNVGSAMLTPFWRMHAAYFSSASCVLTGAVVSGVVPAVDPSEATWAEAFLPPPQAEARRASEIPRTAIG